MDHEGIDRGDNKESRSRRQPRLKWEAEVTIRSKGELLPGRTLDISESGLSAILPVEMQVGEIAELSLKVPMAMETSRAVVRNRNVFRHGFEFLQPLHDVVGHEAADNCPPCCGTRFIVQAVDGGRGVAFMRTRCRDCGDTDKQAE